MDPCGALEERLPRTLQNSSSGKALPCQPLELLEATEGLHSHSSGRTNSVPSAMGDVRPKSPPPRFRSRARAFGACLTSPNCAEEQRKLAIELEYKILLWLALSIENKSCSEDLTVLFRQGKFVSRQRMKAKKISISIAAAAAESTPQQQSQLRGTFPALRICNITC